MDRKSKEEVVKFLSSEFDKSEAIIVCDYSGVTVPSLETLRANAKEKNTKVQVAKNTLVQISLEKAGIKDISLSGTNIFLWGEDQIGLSKVAVNFAKTNENFEVKSAIIEKKSVDLSTIEALSKLPGKDELLGMLLSVWIAPVRNFTVGLDNLRAKKESA